MAAYLQDLELPELITNETEIQIDILEPGTEYKFELWTLGDEKVRSKLPAITYGTTSKWNLWYKEAAESLF